MTDPLAALPPATCYRTHTQPDEHLGVKGAVWIADVRRVTLAPTGDAPTPDAPKITPAPGGVHNHGTEDSHGLSCREYRIGNCRLAPTGDAPTPEAHTSHAPLPQGWKGCAGCESIPPRPTGDAPNAVAAIKDFLLLYNGSMTEGQLHDFVRERFGFAAGDVDRRFSTGDAPTPDALPLGVTNLSDYQKGYADALLDLAPTGDAPTPDHHAGHPNRETTVRNAHGVRGTGAYSNHAGDVPTPDAPKWITESDGSKTWAASRVLKVLCVVCGGEGILPADVHSQRINALSATASGSDALREALMSMVREHDGCDPNDCTGIRPSDLRAALSESGATNRKPTA
jgi:hypothetical protein